MRGSAAIGLLLAMPFASAAGPEADTGGAQIYQEACAACHGASLEGGGGPNAGPALKGAAFAAKWAKASSPAFLAFVHDVMPLNQPGSLDPATSAKAANYVLAQNGLPTAAAAAEHVPTRQERALNLLVKAEDRDAAYQVVMADRAALLGKLRPIAAADLAAPAAADWLGWRGSSLTHAYSTLRSIDRRTVPQLAGAWSLALDPGANGIAPLVHDGVMFLDNNGTVLALDARNGDLLWQFARPVKPHNLPNSQPRGMALSGTSLFVPTLDNHLIALDMRSGRLLWDQAIAPPDAAVQITAAPIVVRDKVIQGMSWCVGATTPGGCYIVALDAKTGHEAWRFNTVARPGQPGGDSWNGAPLERRFGGSVWQTGSYDPELNLVYFGVGQTYVISSLLDDQGTKGASNDALFTNSTLALDPDTGRLVWYYQHAPGDVWDLDWAFEQTIAGTGKDKMVLTAGKLGIFDAIDARTGHYLWSVDPGYQTLVVGIDPKTGRKRYDPAFSPPKVDIASFICPAAIGNRNWPSTAYDPTVQLLFVPMNPSCMDYVRHAAAKTVDKGGLAELSYTQRRRPDSDGRLGVVAAIDVAHRRMAWIDKRRAASSSAILATAGGLVFTGGRDRAFRALDSATGRTLWQTWLPAPPNAFPLSYAVDGRQYVAVVAGGGTAVDVFFSSETPELPRSNASKTITVFALPDQAVPGSARQ